LMMRAVPARQPLWHIPPKRYCTDGLVGDATTQTMMNEKNGRLSRQRQIPETKFLFFPTIRYRTIRKN